jgi:hypothetical protein
MVLITVLPYWANFLSKYITWSAVVESSPVVGSSKNMIPGFVINYTPIDVLFLYPPDIPLINVFPILVSAHDLSPRSRINCYTL